MIGKAVTQTMPGQAPADKAARHHVVIGVALAAARGARLGTSAALTPARLSAPLADAVWRSWPLSPARHAVERELAGLASRGRSEEQELRRRFAATRDRLVIETLERPELESLIAAALDSPATDRIVQRVLESPGVERAIVQVLESELLLQSTERALRGQEVRCS
jgi:hypothetical protein